MKKGLSFKLFLGAFAMITASMQAAEVANKAFETGFKLAASAKQETACNAIGKAGRFLALLNDSNKTLACGLCGEQWQATGKDPNAYRAVCGTGLFSDKQQQLINKAIDILPMTGEKGCLAIGTFGRTLGTLTPDQKNTIFELCGDDLKDKHPNAYKAISGESASMKTSVEPLEPANIEEIE